MGQQTRRKEIRRRRQRRAKRLKQRKAERMTGIPASSSIGSSRPGTGGGSS